MPRFQPDVFDQNLVLVDKVTQLAKSKNITSSQLAIAWVLHQGQFIIPIPGATTKARVDENSKAAEVKLSKQELDEIREILNACEIKGGRYPEAHADLLNG